MQTAGFELARSRSRSCVLTDRPTRRRGRVARIELDVYIVHSSKIQYKICMVKSHTKCTQAKKRNPEKSSLPRPRTIALVPSMNFLSGLRFLARGVAFCCPASGCPVPQAWRWGTRSVPKFHSESSLRAAIHTQISVTVYECRYLTICWAGFAQIHRGGPVKKFGKVSCRSQIERSTSHSSGTKEDPDFQRSHKLNWTPNRNRGWVEATAPLEQQ